jgi:hypothetical protein
MVHETVLFKWQQKTWRGCESARVYRTIKQRWTDAHNLLHYADSSNLLACCVIHSVVSLFRLRGWTTWPKILSPRAAQPTLAQHGIVSRAQPTVSWHKLSPEHSPLSFDVKCVQKRPHCLTTQTLSRTQTSAVRHKLCSEQSPHSTTQIVSRAKPTLLRHKLCPEQGPHSYDTNCVQSKAHTLTTQIVSRAKPTLLRHKLCPEQSPLTLKATYFLSV